MIVVDVNVVAYFFIDGEKTALARKVMLRDRDWRLPVLWRHEYLNVLATYARQGGATVAQASMLWQRALERFGSREEPVDAQTVLALAIGKSVSAYDGQYLALTQRLGAIFVTEDRRLRKAFPSIARSMQEFVLA